MRVTKSLLVCVAALACGGCVFPCPSTTRIAPAIEGCIIDAHTRAPVPGALVEHRYDDQIGRRATTDDDGRFRIGPLDQFHWGYLVGIALNYPVPYWKVFPATPAETRLIVTHPDYQSHERALRFNAPAADPNQSSPPDPMDRPIPLTPRGECRSRS